MFRLFDCYGFSDYVGWMSLLWYELPYCVVDVLLVCVFCCFLLFRLFVCLLDFWVFTCSWFGLRDFTFEGWCFVDFVYLVLVFGIALNLLFCLGFCYLYFLWVVLTAYLWIVVHYLFDVLAYLLVGCVICGVYYWLLLVIVFDAGWFATFDLCVYFYSCNC